MNKTVKISAAMGEDFQARADIRGHQIVIDQPVNAGGEDTGPTPLEYGLLALAGCYTAIGRIIANQRGLPVFGMQVEVEGDLNVDGLLGKPTDNRIGFSQMRVRVRVEGPMSDDEKREFVELVETRCPISDNLSNGTDIQLEVASAAV